MKQLAVFSFVAMIFIIIIGSFQSVLDPEDFTGQWYSADNQNSYQFQDGLILCQKHAVALSEMDSFSGAYTFCKKSIFLFAKGIDGLETEKELYLVRKSDGSFLCENQDGSGRVYFIRSSK